MDLKVRFKNTGKEDRVSSICFISLQKYSFKSHVGKIVFSFDFESENFFLTLKVLLVVTLKYHLLQQTI